ncbi:hypothetical protein PCANC_07705 [Puccinia coronata f. sp. avenae]|uniref:Uncharacterized protein n=1 Tax=Puccinia coronata f. sp. avenae TaxID=200324 RepID=A0A2N5VRF9_9BASI|nr:hypothetical protein PCANC_07705 [Puccinia coronata f. sp. avenae]
MSAGPTDTLEQRNNVLVGPADVTSVYKTDVTSVAATDLAAGGCNQYNPFGGVYDSTDAWYDLISSWLADFAVEIAAELLGDLTPSRA